MKKVYYYLINHHQLFALVLVTISLLTITGLFHESSNGRVLGVADTEGITSSPTFQMYFSNTIDLLSSIVP